MLIVTCKRSYFEKDQIICNSDFYIMPNEWQQLNIIHRKFEQDVLMYKLLFILSIYLIFSLINETFAKTQPPIQLATKYKKNHQYPINSYWISEKLDGVRGYWNGNQLFTKNGNIINTPISFTNNWPTTSLDGELWIKRNSFEQVVSCITRKTAGPCWQNIHFMVFDSSSEQGVFTDRLSSLINIINKSPSSTLKLIKQYKINSNELLFKKLDTVVDNKGEGLMLHYEKAKYVNGRNKHIMKLKRYDDAEAIILKYIQGKGKYLNQLGAIQVKTKEGIIFKIGSGFSDEERKNPPPIGATITFKYIGKTQKGTPKFASFVRQRKIDNN